MEKYRIEGSFNSKQLKEIVFFIEAYEKEMSLDDSHQLVRVLDFTGTSSLIKRTLREFDYMVEINKTDHTATIKLNTI